MASIITTIQIENSPYNKTAEVYGNLTLESGWQCYKRGFKYQYISPPTWNKSVTGDFEGGEYHLTLSSLVAYTIYYYFAYADLKRWVVDEGIIPEGGYWIYDSVYGDIKNFRTNAIANVKTHKAYQRI